jgi:hypothetical protein
MPRKRPGAGPHHRGHGGRAETKDACGKRPSSLSQVFPQYAVSDGRRCVGFVIARREGFEAFDHNERSLGISPTIREAAAAILAQGAAR